MLEYPLDVHGNEDDRVLRHAFLNSYHPDRPAQPDGRSHRGSRLRGGTCCPRLMASDYTEGGRNPVRFHPPPHERGGGGQGQARRRSSPRARWRKCSPFAATRNTRGMWSRSPATLSEEILATVRRYNEAGLRVIAVAHKTNPMVAGAFSVADESDMVLIGLSRLPRSARRNPRRRPLPRCKEYGVDGQGADRGQRRGDAQSSAARSGLAVHIPCCWARTWTAMDDAALARSWRSVRTFSPSCTPQQKARIVTCLRENGPYRGLSWATASTTRRR